MATITKEDALRYHENGRPGKIAVIPTKPYNTATDLSLAYSPGVAFPCLEIEKDPDSVFSYTDKGNLVAVISNGTAVLGLGDIGAMSGKPVMEGKGLLFKIYGGVDVFDIEVDEKDPEKFCETVERIAPTFGGINLEDIKAPECFYIEERLKRTLDIPVMHDDQHGTAIISSAGLINALEVVGKKIEDIKIVVNGAGAAAICCTRLYVRLGARRENILMLDSKGVITSDREGLCGTKKEFATDRCDVHTLSEAIVGADLFLGLSKGNVLTQDMVKTMAANPIVFALANPTPEITYEDAKASRSDILIATGRSDYPNQINNVIGFPYIFRGALDVQATAINEEMKLAAVHAIADLAKKPIPKAVSEIYQLDQLRFGPDYLIPKPIDQRLIVDVSIAVAKAAIESGVARKIITDWDEYRRRLRRIMGYESLKLQQLYEVARQKPQKLMFTDGEMANVIEAASMACKAKICQPILLGNRSVIEKIAEDRKLDISRIDIVSSFSTQSSSEENNYVYGVDLIREGKIDALLISSCGDTNGKFKKVQESIGLLPGYGHFAGINAIISNETFYFIGDTLVNEAPDKETLKDITKLMDKAMKAINIDPVIACISYSNSDSTKDGVSKKMRELASELRSECEGINIDGEMTLDTALDKGANCLVFDSLSASNCTYRMLKYAQGIDIIGPIQVGLNKAVHFIDTKANALDILNIAAMACVDAILKKSL